MVRKREGEEDKMERIWGSEGGAETRRERERGFQKEEENTTKIKEDLRRKG